MKLLVVIAALIICVILCDRYEERLPTPIKQLYALWKQFSHILGIVMSFLILSLLWFVGFGMYAIILNIIRLPTLFARAPDTYWIDAEKTTVESMQYQC